MSVTFRLFPSKNLFSIGVRTILQKIDPNVSYGEDKGESYAQIKINEHFLNMPEEFFPSAFRKSIQKELKKVTVMENNCVPPGEGPGNNSKHRIGGVEISVTDYNNYFFIGNNITGMIRAIIFTKKLKKALANYASPSHFYSEDFLITKEIKNLTKANKVLRAEMDDLEKIHKLKIESLETENETLKLKRRIDAELQKKPALWKFWLWKF